MTIKRALVIGIDEYGEGGELYGCVNDAKTVASLLSRNEDESLNFDVQTILNGNATRKSVLSDIHRAFDDYADHGLLYFSGHGSEDSSGSHLVPVDFRDSGTVSISEIVAILASSKVVNKTIIFDSCYSGGAGDMAGTNAGQAALPKGTSIMTACRENEFAIERNGRGLFTSLLIGALEEEAADLLGNVTIGGVYAHVDRSLGSWEQRPIFKANVEAYAPLRTVNPNLSASDFRSIPAYFLTGDSVYQLDPSYEFMNTPEKMADAVQPYAVDENVQIFKTLQRLESVGLVKPSDADHMYFAAM